MTAVKELKPGLVGTASVTVVPENTAKAVGSGLLPVFGTPSMCALMEEAACNAIDGCLEDGMGSVGISLDITHDAPSDIGQKVTATATLVAVDGRKLTYELKVVDDKKPVGKGKHERFIINKEKFMAKLKK